MLTEELIYKCAIKHDAKLEQEIDRNSMVEGK